MGEVVVTAQLELELGEPVACCTRRGRAVHAAPSATPPVVTLCGRPAHDHVPPWYLRMHPPLVAVCRACVAAGAPAEQLEAALEAYRTARAQP